MSINFFSPCHKHLYGGWTWNSFLNAKRAFASMLDFKIYREKNCKKIREKNRKMRKIYTYLDVYVKVDAKKINHLHFSYFYKKIYFIKFIFSYFR